MTLLILASTGNKIQSWAKAHTVRIGLCRPQICDDATSDGPHCKVKFRG